MDVDHAVTKKKLKLSFSTRNVICLLHNLVAVLFFIVQLKELGFCFNEQSGFINYLTKSKFKLAHDCLQSFLSTAHTDWLIE